MVVKPQGRDEQALSTSSTTPLSYLRNKARRAGSIRCLTSVKTWLGHLNGYKTKVETLHGSRSRYPPTSTHPSASPSALQYIPTPADNWNSQQPLPCLLTGTKSVTMVIFALATFFVWLLASGVVVGAPIQVPSLSEIIEDRLALIAREAVSMAETETKTDPRQSTRLALLITAIVVVCFSCAVVLFSVFRSCTRLGPRSPAAPAGRV